MTDMHVSCRQPLTEKYSDYYIYSCCSLITNADFIAPQEMNRFYFVFVKNHAIEAPGYSCQLQEALSENKLSWMIFGALKTLSSSKKHSRIIVTDIDSPENLIGVQLKQSASNNWHYDIDDFSSNEGIEKVNPLEYTYFQDDKYFIAIRKNENYEDIFMYVYKK